MPEQSYDVQAVANLSLNDLTNTLAELRKYLSGNIDPVLARQLLSKFSGRRAEFVLMVNGLYDILIEPMNLPGPDTIIDPIIRAIVGRMATHAYDEILEWLEEQAKE